jgi:hypothetical protein
LRANLLDFTLGVLRLLRLVADDSFKWSKLTDVIDMVVELEASGQGCPMLGCRMDERMRREATVTLLEWIAAAHGEKVAHCWAYNLTPIPCGLPLDSQLENGLRLATGEVSLGELLRRADEEISAAMAEYKRATRVNTEDATESE